MKRHTFFLVIAAFAVSVNAGLLLGVTLSKRLVPVEHVVQVEDLRDPVKETAALVALWQIEQMAQEYNQPEIAVFARRAQK